jgi:hypothetical protein
MDVFAPDSGWAGGDTGFRTVEVGGDCFCG